MKFKVTFLVILGFLCLFPDYLSAQCDIQRESIEDLDADEQCELRNLMLDYLVIGFDDTAGPNDWNKYPIVDMHFNPPFGSPGDFHNYMEEFATWHRNYVQGMEEYILSRGYTQYVPLPYWSPHMMIPDAFYNYACPDDDGNDTYANLPESDDFPPYDDQGPFAPAPFINFTQFDQNLDCDDWANVDDFVGSMEGPHHDATHGAVGGTLGPPTSASASTLFWLFHAYITDLHSCYLRQCEEEEADIYVRDNAADNGSEPTPQTTELWTSPDIWVRNDSDGFANTTVEELCFKINDDDEVKPVYVYVRTWNKGNVPSKNDENDLEVYWAKPSAGLNWPSPWDGIPTANSCDLPVGGFIGSQSLRSVNGQYLDVNDVDMDGDNTEIIEGYTIYEFQWFPPDPTLYVDCFGDGWEKGHFCIHARLDDGDGFNLTGSFYSDLVENNDLALKNIYIYGEDDENEGCDDIIWVAPPDGGCVFFGNYTPELMTNVGLALNFPTDKDEALFDNNEINLTLKGGVMQKWMQGGKNGENINYTEGNTAIEFTANNGYIEGITLQPMEIYLFCLEIVGDPGQSDGLDLEVDVVQTVDRQEVGGQRFRVKKVTPPKKSKELLNNTNMDVSSFHKIFPNPTTGKLTISLDNYIDTHDIFITSSVGQIMKKYIDVKGDKTVDVSDLGRGIFLMRIENRTTGKFEMKKLIVE